jgi:DNA gyrase inhibitor GyrI
MNDTVVELQEIPVLRVRADMVRGGPSEAMQMLESKLPTLKGRKFYGVFREMPDGEEYYACVAKIEADDPSRMRLETGVIPGGKYARRKITNWEKIIRDGELPRVTREFSQAHDTDPSRFTIEFYRSQEELQLLVPLRGSSTNTREDA